MDNWITLLYIWNKWSNILQYKIKVKLKKKTKNRSSKQMPTLLRGEHSIPEGMSSLGDLGWCHILGDGAALGLKAGLSWGWGSWGGSGGKWTHPSKPVVVPGSPNLQIQVGPPIAKQSLVYPKEVRSLGLDEFGTVPQSPGGVATSRLHP